MTLGVCFVTVIVAQLEQTAMDGGMEGFDPPIHHLWISGQVGDIFNIEAGLFEGAGCAAGRNQLYAKSSKGFRAFDEPFLI